MGKLNHMSHDFAYLFSWYSRLGFGPGYLPHGYFSRLPPFAFFTRLLDLLLSKFAFFTRLLDLLLSNSFPPHGPPCRFRLFPSLAVCARYSAISASGSFFAFPWVDFVKFFNGDNGFGAVFTFARRIAHLLLANYFPSHGPPC
jgi:hypothetical protein